MFITSHTHSTVSGIILKAILIRNSLYRSFNMGSGDAGEAAVTVQPTTDTKQRKVSIQSDPVSESRLSYDNYGYDLHPRRKISQVKVDTGCIRV